MKAQASSSELSKPSVTQSKSAESTNMFFGQLIRESVDTNELSFHFHIHVETVPQRLLSPLRCCPDIICSLQCIYNSGTPFPESWRH